MDCGALALHCAVIEAVTEARGTSSELPAGRSSSAKPMADSCVFRSLAASLSNWKSVAPTAVLLVGGFTRCISSYKGFGDGTCLPGREAE